MHYDCIPRRRSGAAAFEARGGEGGVLPAGRRSGAPGRVVGTWSAGRRARRTGWWGGAHGVDEWPGSSIGADARDRQEPCAGDGVRSHPRRAEIGECAARAGRPGGVGRGRSRPSSGGVGCAALRGGQGARRTQGEGIRTDGGAARRSFRRRVPAQDQPSSGSTSALTCGGRQPRARTGWPIQRPRRSWHIRTCGSHWGPLPRATARRAEDASRRRVGSSRSRQGGPGRDQLRGEARVLPTCGRNRGGSDRLLDD